MKTTFNLPQQASSTFTTYHAPTATFPTVDTVEVIPDPSMSPDTTAALIYAATVRTTLKSEATDDVHYTIEAEQDHSSSNPTILLKITIFYKDIIFGSVEHGTPPRRIVTRKEGLSEYRLEIKNLNQFFHSINNLLDLCDYTEKEPILWYRTNLMNTYKLKKDMVVLSSKNNDLKPLAMFDFTGQKQREQDIVEHEMFKKKKLMSNYEKKEKDRVKNSRGVLNYLKNNKWLTAADTLLGTVFWFGIVDLIGALAAHGNQHDLGMIQRYFDFMFIQHWYSIPFFWMTGFLTRYKATEHLRLATRFTSLDRLKRFSKGS